MQATAPSAREIGNFASVLMKSGPNKAVASLIVPSTLIERKKITEAYKSANVTIQKINKSAKSLLLLERKTFSPAGGVVCDGIHITHKQPTSKTVVYCMPNGALWPHILDGLMKMSRALVANVVCYNWRGAGLGKGHIAGEKDLISDTQKIIDTLKNQRIFLHGWSLGGAVAIQVAEALQKKGQTTPCAIERSFSSLKKFLRTQDGCWGPLANWIVGQSGWRLASEESLRNLRGHVIVMSAPGDELMDRCSLDGAAAKLSSKNIHRIIMEPSEETCDSVHSRDWYPGELRQYTNEVNKIFR